MNTIVKKNAIVKRNAIVKDFKWKDKSGVFWLPKDMETRHLFYTIRMIWNHSMPLGLRSKHFIKYRFDPKFYTKKYMKDAVLILGQELRTRDDIRDDWVLEIESWCIDRQKLIDS